MGLIYYLFKLKSEIAFSLSSFLLVINSTFLNLQYPNQYPMYFYLTCILAILAKLIFREKFTNKSICNPSIAAILIASFAFPQILSTSTRFWSGEWYHILTILILGSIVVKAAGTFLISISYIVSHILFSSLIYYFGMNFNLDYFEIRNSLFLNIALLSFGNLLFIFHVISDPLTSPKTKSNHVLFGSFIAILDVALKYLDIVNSSIIAYMAITIFWYWFYSIKNYRLSFQKS